MQPKRRNSHGRRVPPPPVVAAMPEIETGARNAAPVAAVSESVPRARKWSPMGIVLVAIAAVCNVAQAWQLGFYLDDWPTYANAVHYGWPFSVQRLSFFFDVDRSRPGLAAGRWVFSSLLGDSPVGWHVAMLLANVAVVIALYRLIRVLDRRMSPGLAAGIASLWLLQPWLAANRFWVIMFPIDLVVVLFAYLCVWAIRGWESGKAPWLAPGLAYLACCLSYEAFYLQFIPLLMIGAALIMAGRAKRASVAITGVALAVAQAGAMAFKFFGPRTEGMVRNPRTDYERQLRAVSYFFGTFTQSFDELALPIGIVAAAAAVVVAAALLTGRSRTRRENVRAGLLLASCIVGGAICILAYLSGGAQMMTIGTGSRVTMFLGFWAVPGIAVCIMEIEARSPSRLAAVAAALGVGLALLFGASYWMREQDWAKAWRKQREILAHVPVADMLRVPPDALILYVGQQAINGAPVFLKKWDIDAAVPLAYPALRNRWFDVYNLWDGTLVWDGTKLKTETGAVHTTARALYIWQPELRAFRKAPKFTIINTDYSITLPPFPALWE